MFRNLLTVTGVVIGFGGALLFIGVHGQRDAMKRGNEAATVSALDIIARAQRTYRTEHEGTCGTFHQLARAGFVDQRYDSDRPRLNSYVFTMTVTSRSAGFQKDAFAIYADPDGQGARVRHFYFDASGVHVNSCRSASANDPLLDDPWLQQLLEEPPKSRN